MGVSGIGSQTSLIVQSLVDMRRQLDDLQRQLGTGQKADTYAGMGLERGLAVGLRSHLAALGGYDNAITNVGVRIDLAQGALDRMSDITHSVKAAAFQSPSIDSSGATIAQSTAYSELGELLGLLNIQVGDRYLFSGRASDRPAVETLEHVMNGDGARAGFKQVVAERKQADLGASGLGRLVISTPTATSVQVAEDAVSPFGFKLAGRDLEPDRRDGDAIRGRRPPTRSISAPSIRPPATPSSIASRCPTDRAKASRSTATTSTTPGTNQFTIGATSAVTARQPAGRAHGGDRQARRHLAHGGVRHCRRPATSSRSMPPTAPQRVAGPPFDSATSLVAGTAADTVTWYTGENGADPARATATARIDASIAVSYGLRANEQGIRWVVQNVAALAAMTFTQSDPERGCAQRRAQSARRDRARRAVRHPEDRGHPGRACRRAVHPSGRRRPPHADQEHARRHAAADRRRVERGRGRARSWRCRRGCRPRCRRRRCSTRRAW